MFLIVVCIVLQSCSKQVPSPKPKPTPTNPGKNY